MKILIVSTVVFRLNGITSVILNYYRNMNKRNMQIDFVVLNEISEEHRTELEQNGSHIYYIPRTSNVLNYQYKLYKLLINSNYDVIHIHGNSATMLIDILPAVIAKIPVRIVHSHNTTCSHMTIHKLFMPIFKFCYTHGFACNNEAGKWLFNNKPFIEIKNGIDLKKYQYNENIRVDMRNKINVNDNIVLGHIGNFIEQKNHVFLLEKFKELLKVNNKFILLLIGEGPLWEEMKNKAYDLKISDKVIFLGKTTEVQNYLQAMDILVLPSLHEGLPVVLVEAQAAGLPCIVSDKVSKAADLTDSIEFVSIDNTTKWVNAICKQSINLENRDRRKIANSWQEKIAESGYDITVNANKMKELYKEYLA